MTKAKNIYVILTSLAILIFAFSAFAQENQNENATKIISKVQLRYEDQNGDGVCDYYGTEHQGGNRQAMNSQHRNENGKGNGDGEGKYTRTRSRSKDRDCDGTGRKGKGRGDGRGQGQGHSRRW